jgi:hypothetical protein
VKQEKLVLSGTVCPTRYRTRNFFINYNNYNFTINEDIATKFEADLHIN